MSKRLRWGVLFLLLPMWMAVAQTPETPEEPLPLTLKVWLPDMLMPPDSAAYDRFTDQIAAFERAHPNIRVLTRVRLSGETGTPVPGDLLYALRTAAAVAPGALPDLTLMRRIDLVAANSYRVLAVLDDFTIGSYDETAVPAAVRALGLAADDIVGIPYLIQVEHMVYLGDPPTESDFDAFLDHGERFAFPMGRANALPRLFLAQYSDAVAPIAADGSTVIDGEGLRAVYEFYERARARDLLLPGIETFVTGGDYLPLLLEGELRAATLSSTLYLRAAASGRAPIRYGPLPTLSGEPVTVVDGWLWTLNTRDSARVAAARLLLDWLLEPERQFLLAQSIPALPSQPAALRLWADEAYAVFVSGLLNRAVIPPDTLSATGRALQAGLLAVLSGERTAAQAVRDVIAQTDSG